MRDTRFKYEAATRREMRILLVPGEPAEQAKRAAGAPERSGVTGSPRATALGGSAGRSPPT
jgi:hypothetical protein